MKSMIDELVKSRILLNEAVGEFEKLYIQSALERNSGHLSKTADVLGIHRNTLAKRVSEYEAAARPKPRKNGYTRRNSSSRK
ncbi:MAG: helix-turn-helix domain-containing protein [Chloracidobacterium sp.]|nr:helix-turn-helix domain-containing protein [Chloracidobacterium sp.]